MLQSVLAYLAGFMDADGTFTIHKQYTHCPNSVPVKFSPRLAATNTDVKPLQLFQALFGGSINIKPPAGGKPVYHWRVGAATARRVAHWLLPYLIIKKRQAEVFQQWPLMSRRKGAPTNNKLEIYQQQQQLVELIHTLNQ